MLGFLLLQDPHEPGLAVVAELNDVVEMQDTGWEPELRLKIYGLLLADIMPSGNFSVLAVFLNVLGGHLQFAFG